MRGRRLLVPLLLFSLSAFRALACASSPDPLWVPGVYDDADYDDVILTIGSLDARWLDPLLTLGPSERLLTRGVVPAREDGRSVSRLAPGSGAPPTR